MNGPSIRADKNRINHSQQAYSLIEVMVATTIFAMVATALTGLFLQNLWFSKWQSNNVHITNTSFGLLDQIKNMGAQQLWTVYLNPTLPLNVTAVDPSDPNDGYKTIALKVNEKDTTVINTTWTAANLKLGRLSTSPEIPVGYWISIKRNSGTSPARDVLEFTLTYRWTLGAKQTKTSSQLQVSFPAPRGTFN